MQITNQKLFEYGGRQISKYTLSNNSGMTMEVLDLGCVIWSLHVPDRNGKLTDVVLGYQDPKEYFTNPEYLGAVVGRSANRIDSGKFMWQGEEIQLEVGAGGYHLHGASDGFTYKVWECVDDQERLSFKLNSPNGEGGYPGEVTCYVSYDLTDENELVINYKVTTPDLSLANLTNHTYFNLNGDGSPTILNHYLKINSEKFTEVNSEIIPTGKFLSVEDTPLDFREYKTMGEDIEADYEQLKLCEGYDHNYVLKEKSLVDAVAYSPETGIQLEMTTNSPGVQLYAGNSLSENLIGKTGQNYKPRSGFCLETQFFPDAPNHPEFLQPIVTKDKPQEFTTKFKFSVRD
ncbi:MAG TPA: galactose mutarotase [Clostridiaceae bacterium]|nr:galactose mutarotase [Clostridiaceae bacterium]